MRALFAVVLLYFSPPDRLCYALPFAHALSEFPAVAFEIGL